MITTSPQRRNRQHHGTSQKISLWRLVLLFIGTLVVLWFYFSWQLLVVMDHNHSSPSENNQQAPPLLPTSSTSITRVFNATGKQDPTGGAFVHIGKTGGSTLSKLMRNGCPSMIERPCYHVPKETIVSKLVHSYYHVMDFGLLPQSNHDFYLLSLRDPFDRLVSAFCYEHMRNRHATNNTGSLNRFQIKVLDNAYKCFPTLEDFASYFQQGDPYQFHYPYKYNIVEPKPCRDFALAVFHGKVRLFHHLYFNYQQIRSLIPNIHQQTILATRLETLWEDWTSANTYLGQSIETILIPDAHLRDTSHLDLPVTKELSVQGREAICLALQLEYNAYFWLVSRAKNLNRHDLAATLVRARQRCPSVQLDFKALLQ